jgi:hypothetical protein
MVYSDVVTTPAQDLWIEETSRRAGFASAAAFAGGYALKPYRLTQLYRSAAKELVDGSTRVLAFGEAVILEPSPGFER